MFDIESIQALFDGNAVRVTQHFRTRIKERGIKFSEIKLALLTGKIIEQNVNDQPLPSVIILGYNDDNPLHVVVSIDGALMWLITAYYPSSDIWESDYKTRKVG